LCAEEPDDERLWITLFRLYERTGSVLGLDWAVRRLKTSLGEMASDEGEDVDKVELPKNIERIVEEIRRNIEKAAGDTSGGGPPTQV
jgi:hypothetical protein